jgi:maltose alpha-D-glucosyltransferase/alpha-amylase
MKNIKHVSPRWLETAVFYQIYPQSFYDTNGDGIGDLRGIIAKLDYIRSLGVTALWLNPIFESPFGDAGYDISDFYRVAPRYGTNADLVRLCRQAHQRGMKVCLDLVPGHTSNQHPWFLNSARPEKNKFTNWYIWTDSVWNSQGGTGAPSEPRAVRGFSNRDAGYIPNFFYFQPALNYGYAPSRSAKALATALNASRRAGCSERIAENHEILARPGRRRVPRRHGVFAGAGRSGRQGAARSLALLPRMA